MGTVCGARADFQNLSEENIVAIYRHLEIADLGCCSRVNKTWLRIANDRKIWEEKFESLLKYYEPLLRDVSQLAKKRKNYLERSLSKRNFKN